MENRWNRSKIPRKIILRDNHILREENQRRNMKNGKEPTMHFMGKSRISVPLSVSARWTIIVQRYNVASGKHINVDLMEKKHRNSNYINMEHRGTKKFFLSYQFNENAHKINSYENSSIFISCLANLIHSTNQTQKMQTQLELEQRLST